MRYFYRYEVLSQSSSGADKRRIISADNPAHLMKRFKKLHKNEKIISWKVAKEA